MNERIKELALQATECYSNGQERTFNKEKFAELLVQECIRLCDQVDLSGADDCMDKIRDHFGVDE